MWTRNRCKGIAVALLAPLAVFSQSASAQGTGYPSRPVTLLVGYAAGGATDLATRLLADKLKTLLGQPVVVENRPGAGGHLSFTAAKDSAPDGYLLAVATPATIALKVTSKDYTLDPIKDFTYVAQFVTASNPLLLVAPTSVAYKTLGEFIAYARANPGSVNFATLGGQTDLDVASFAYAAGIKITMVRYKGSTPQQQALATGEVGVAYDSIGAAKPNLDGNRIRILAVTAAKRDPGLPDAPAITEAVPGFWIPPFWFGLIGPTNMPRAVVSRLNEATKSAMAQPDINPRLAPMGMKAEVGSSDEFRTFALGELDRLVKAAKLIGMEPQ